MMKTIYFNNAILYSETDLIKEPVISIENNQIMSIKTKSEVPSIDEEIKFNESEPVAIVPGFIDIHIHGAAGADVMDGEKEALQTMRTALPAEGTTSFLATTITQQHEAKLQALKTIKNVIVQQDKRGADILGVHLEGPFISKKRAGAQPSEFIQQADNHLFQEFQEASGHHIKLVTMAPEEDPDGELISLLCEQQVIPSIGHSNATYDEVVKAIEKGMSQVTHLFNGMKGVHHRDLGVAGAALLHDELMTELIVDGIHVSPPMVKLAYKSKGADNIILITDAMRAKGMAQGESTLGGQKVIVNHDRATLEDGTLAGSILKMNNAIKNMMSYTGCSLKEAVQMASLNPAKQLRIDDRKGSLAVGKDADFTVLSPAMTVLQTYVMGEKVFG
ncbi:N-acetylglucosamine-6-phosphate deacetylase [Salipaludibacillus sp. LMS25]|jgi:N-acetylglucosamine-6-phosphate deacetylase|uniref:N-acetylglucosamine-6-phosphate deacetylase n=1 Tax=Salipaludibacillus sp. LMS25 TaxID=2924031 RepID=UPI0020D0A220|nr:N-acetylglucosamine-6-phosphate deacetylase [Salipaludibacillus sp. LMS25]UTR13363.1 N-acetylglucosamine-6-phosphate deacetylase [Salipaludibacillus sp. LMS25]